MQSSSFTAKDKATLGIMIVGFLATTYGFYRFLSWLNPQPIKPQNKSYSTQSMNGNVIRTSGSISHIQKGSAHKGNPKVTIQCTNGDLSINEWGKFNINQEQVRKSGLLLNELAIALANISLETIHARGTGRLLLHTADSLQEQKIILTSEDINSNFSLKIENHTLKYNFTNNNSMKTKPLLEVWIRNTNDIRLDLEESIKPEFAKKKISSFIAEHSMNLIS